MDKDFETQDDIDTILSVDEPNLLKHRLQRNEIRKVIKTLDRKTRLKFYNGDSFSYNERTKTLKVPIYHFICSDQIHYFKDLDFSYFNAEIFINTIKNYKRYTIGEWEVFLKFAKAFGCFSDEKVLDKSGRETNITLGQKATNVLRDMFKSNVIDIRAIYGMFNSIPANIKPDQNFLHFISQTRGRKRFINLESLLGLEKKYPGIFSRVMFNFEQAENYRETLDEKGRVIKIAWDKALEMFYRTVTYEGVTKENIDIADLFATRGVPQSTFEEASSLREEAKSGNIPEHILGTHIKEETILETIERIKQQTEHEIADGRQIVEEMYSKKFTYEWLSKNDPHNSIIGLFVSCCASITIDTYGSQIARSSVIAPDVQNLVVRDLKGNIISKGTMYINSEYGYAVFNDFELNSKYRYHEVEAGIFYGEDNTPNEQNREQIFQALQRGIQAFIDEYDRQHPENPLRQVNVGMGYNKFKKQVRRFMKETNNLTIPSEYDFLDADQEQYILYKREEHQKDDSMDRNGDIEL